MPGTPSPPRLALLLALTPLSAAMTTPVAAQDPEAAAVSDWRIGGSVGLPGSGSEVIWPAATVGVHAAWLPPRSLGLDLSFGTAPVLLSLGGLGFGARGGVTLPLHAQSVLILPSAGASMIGSLSGYGAEGIFGSYLGAALVGDKGFRTGLTLHWLVNEPGPVWLLEVGILRALRR